MPSGIGHFNDWQDPEVGAGIRAEWYARSSLGMNLGFGSAFINPLSPFPPRRRAPGDGNQANNIQSRVTGFQNQIDLEGIIPRVYGLGYRMFPSHAALPYTLVTGQTSYLHAVFILGWGPLAVDDLKIGDTPIDGFGGDIEYEIRGGLPGDAPLTLFTQDMNDDQQVAPILFGSKVSSNLGLCNYAAIDVLFPNGLYNLTTMTRADGSTYTVPSARTVNFHIEVFVETVGTVVINGPYTITDYNPSAFIRTIVIPLPALNRYILTIERAQAAGNQTTQVDAVRTLSIKGVKYGSPIRPQVDATGAVKGVAYVALRAKGTAKTQGVLDAFNCRVTSKLLSWNGADWVSVPSAAPADVIADLLCGSVNPRPIPRSRLNGAAFQAAKTFSNGKAFGFYHIYDTEGTIEDAIKEVSFAGRCLYIPRDETGKHSVVVEQERSEISQYITPLNSRGFKWTKTWGDIPHAIKAQWISSEANYKSDETIIPRPGYTDLSATTFESQQFIGVTTHQHVYKLGKYQWACALNRPTTYEFEMPAEQLLARIGQRVKVTNDIIGYGLGEGRVTEVLLDVSGNCTGIEVSEPFNMGFGGHDYAIRIRFNDGTSIYKQVVSADGYQTVLTFSDAIVVGGVHPEVDDLVQYSYLNEEADMIITGIEQSDDLTARITCVDYSPEVYSADSGIIPAYSPPVSQPEQAPVYVPPPPQIVEIASGQNLVVQYGNTLITRIKIVFSPPATHRVKYIQYWYKRDDQVDFGTPHLVAADAREIYISNVEEGVLYQIQLRSVADNNQVSAPIETAHTVIGKTELPADVTNVYLNANDLQIEYTPPIDFSHFMVKASNGDGGSYADASVLLQRLVSHSFPISIIPSGLVSIFIKAVDTSGNESENAYKFTYDFGALETQNVVESVGLVYGTTTGNVTFSGSWSQVDIDGLSFLIPHLASLFWSANFSAQFWSSDPSGLFWGRNRNDDAYFQINYTPPSDMTLPWKLSIEHDVRADRYYIQYNHHGSKKFWSGNGAAKFWGNPTDLFWEPEDGSHWKLFVGPLVNPGIKRKHYFRVFIPGAQPYQALVGKFVLSADMPDVEESFANVAITAGGTQLPLDKTFRRVTSVIPILQVDGAYPNAATVKIVDALPYEVSGSNGPTLKVFDTSDVATSGKITGRVKGW